MCEGGDAVFSDSATTATACQDACTKYSGCNYYSYTPTTDECLMFDTCPTLDTEACPKCVSGNPGCAIEDIEKGEERYEHYFANIVRKFMACQFSLLHHGHRRLLREVRRRRRGDHAALQDDGLLLQGGPLLRREGAMRPKCRIIPHHNI